MPNNLSARETNALQRIDFETRSLQGNFVTSAELGPLIGERILIHLLQLGFIEVGRRKHDDGEIGYRTTLDGERFLNGKTWAEITSSAKSDLAIKVPKRMPKG